MKAEEIEKIIEEGIRETNEIPYIAKLIHDAYEFQHPTPTLTDSMIEDIVENSVTKNYVDGKFYAMRVARVALKKARNFMQSGEAPQEYRYLTHEDDNLLERLDSCLAQIEMPSDVNNEYEAVRELISNRLSKTPQESEGDGIDLEKELYNFKSFIESKHPNGVVYLSKKVIDNYLSTRQGESVCSKCVHYLTCRHESRDKRICKHYDNQP